MKYYAVLSLSLLLLTVLPSSRSGEKNSMSLEDKIRRFARTEIAADISALSEGDRNALGKLIEAAKVMDRIYTRQVWEGNEELRRQLEADASVMGSLRFRYYNINMSPWSKIDHDEPFIDGVPAKRPPHANYYPDDMTKEEFNTWVGSLPEAEGKKATGFFHVIRRGDDGRLVTVPYSEEYDEFLKPAAALLREAAGLTDNVSLKTFLVKRADSFLSNDYFDSDVAWMDLDSPIEPTIGPYETYMDELFNYKAAFEAFITLRNDEETRKLEKYSGYLQGIENALPIDPRYRNPKLGAMAPIRVVDEIVVGGEARAGVQTAAFNLPNDEKVVAEKGSKRVMLKNVQEAKFKNVLVPIADIVLDPKQRPYVSFETFFTHILAHELMHGLGPHTITVGGKQTTVRQSLKEIYSAVEEAKADVSGLFALQYLIDKGVVAGEMERQMYVTFLASVFRTIRFGAAESHGKGMVLQMNSLMDAGGFVYDKAKGTYTVNFGKIKGAVRALTGKIMTLQARGDYANLKSLMERRAVLRPETKQTLTKLAGLPVDIEPVFPLAQ